MSIAENLARWVEKKPLILMRFDEAFSESLHESRYALERFTFARPHSVFGNFKLPTLCLVELQGHDSIECYVGVAKRKTAVTTFDSRITVTKLRQIIPSSLETLNERISNKRFSNTFRNKLSQEHFVSVLSPKLSAHIVRMLSDEQGNWNALDVVIAQLPKLRPVANVNWAQENAIQTAMAAFGLRVNDIPNEVAIKQEASSGLSLIGSHLYEDNVVRADASQLPGFDNIAPDITGRAVFEKRDERLVVYTANKLPLEEMLGVDLIYINETRGNIVMIQYKMLEEAKGDDENKDWLFRPDDQLRDEIDRMKFPEFQEKISDYRLNRNPFFFKFVKRKAIEDSHQSFLISLDHLNQILASPEAKGPKGGIRLSYESLDGTYLRETDIINLIRSGYIGTHRTETQSLAAIISEVSRGNRALVLAWQKRIQQRGDNS